MVLVGPLSKFSVSCRGERLGEVTLNVPGRFNIANALATIAVARELDMPFDAIRKGLEAFGGVHRRLEIKGQVNGVTVVDDYGHHPTEIRELWRRPGRCGKTGSSWCFSLTAIPDAEAFQ